MNIFLRELKAHWRSLIIWCVVILFLVVSAMAKFQSYSETGQSMTELLSHMPRALRIVLGMGNLDLATAGGFYGMFYLYLLLMAGIHASMLGAGIIAKEERDKTTEFLIAKPVSRERVISSKLLAALFNILVYNIVTLVFSLAIVGQYAGGEDVTNEILLMMAGMFMLQLIFLSIGAGTAALSRRPKGAGSIATAILLGTYVISAASGIDSRLDGLKYITPFKYFDAEQLIRDGSFQPVFVILSAVIVAAMVCVTYVFYKKKDLGI